jgi:hypothetical protein
MLGTMRFRSALVMMCGLCACGATTTTVVASAPSPAPPIDAAPPDTGPSAALVAAPAWIFRYDAPPRVETWTLRHLGGEALLVVETAAGTTTYVGTATDGPTLTIEVATTTAKLTLACKPATRAIGETCAARKPPSLDVLDCYHPDFATPMTFAPAPGVEYAASCNGYQRIR